jgi:hypothetical protein
VGSNGYTGPVLRDVVPLHRRLIYTDSGDDRISGFDEQDECFVSEHRRLRRWTTISNVTLSLNYIFVV